MRPSLVPDAGAAGPWAHQTFDLFCVRECRLVEATCASGRVSTVSWDDAEPLVTVVVRCDLVVRGPDVAPLWPRPVLRSHEAAGCPFPPPSEPVRAWGLLGEYLRHPGNALVADPHFREG